MNINSGQDQIQNDQKVILKTLAESAATPGCRFLEVGSWMGDSTIILASVAKKHGGVVFCVDWWKGTPGTEIGLIAEDTDVFSKFWKRISDAKLNDVVIPVRGQSKTVSTILSAQSVDFIFIDGDHRYENVLSDIKQYAQVVKPGGIFCGHDCEGYISDYDMEFLETGKNKDCHESVHCGVVLAAGSIFKQYSINNSIWSVRAGDKGEWTPTDMKFPNIKKRRQEPPPPIGITENYVIQRFKNKVFATPISLGSTDITDNAFNDNPDVITAKGMNELVKLTKENLMSTESFPEVLLRIKSLERTLKERTDRLDSLETAMKERTDRLDSLETETAQRAEQVRAVETALSERTERLDSLETEMEQRAEQVRAAETALSERTERLESLETALSERTERLDSLEMALHERTERLESLETALSERTERLKVVEMELQKKPSYIVKNS